MWGGCDVINGDIWWYLWVFGGKLATTWLQSWWNTRYCPSGLLRTREGTRADGWSLVWWSLIGKSRRPWHICCEDLPYSSVGGNRVSSVIIWPSCNFILVWFSWNKQIHQIGSELSARQNIQKEIDGMVSVESLESNEKDQMEICMVGWSVGCIKKGTVKI